MLANARLVLPDEVVTGSVCLREGRIVADVVLNYERLADDFSAFVASLGVGSAPPLPYAKAGHRPCAQRDYRSHYTNDTRDIVARRHAPEIEAFGYEF